MPDKARTLAPRGRADTPRMASWMLAQGLTPDFILCSNAARTRQTLELANATLAVAAASIAYRDELYLADEATILTAARTTPDAVGCLLILGHDPGLHDAACMLTGHGDQHLRRLLDLKFPTAGIAVIDFPMDHWRDLAEGTGTLRHFMAPKRLPA